MTSWGGYGEEVHECVVRSPTDHPPGGRVVKHEKCHHTVSYPCLPSGRRIRGKIFHYSVIFNLSPIPSFFPLTPCVASLTLSLPLSISHIQLFSLAVCLYTYIMRTFILMLILYTCVYQGYLFVNDNMPFCALSLFKWTSNSHPLLSIPPLLSLLILSLSLLSLYLCFCEREREWWKGFLLSQPLDHVHRVFIKTFIPNKSKMHSSEESCCVSKLFMDTFLLSASKSLLFEYASPSTPQSILLCAQAKRLPGQAG